MIDSLLSLAIETAKLAGKSILDYYRKDHIVHQKIDDTPLTLADQASHEVISAELSRTGITIVSEEAAARHIGASHYWLIDPLDGTKDYLAKNDEFTVNIALMKNGFPFFGVIYAPVLDELYAGIVGDGAWKIRNGTMMLLQVMPKTITPRMAVSRFHDNPDAHIFAQENKISEFVPLGAALKYGRLAAGEIDVYPRLVGTSEWDTAAGQAVLEAAGGSMLDWHTGERLCYGKANRRNGRFLAIRAPYDYSDFKLQIYRRELL